jgi:methanogenic corrinoid protein MtbC1
MIGGNAATQKLSERIGADGYEPSAHRAAELAWHLISHERGKD